MELGMKKQYLKSAEKMKGFYDVTERTLRTTKPYVKFSYTFATYSPSEIS